MQAGNDGLQVGGGYHVMNGKSVSGSHSTARSVFTTELPHPADAAVPGLPCGVLGLPCGLVWGGVAGTGGSVLALLRVLGGSGVTLSSSRLQSAIPECVYISIRNKAGSKQAVHHSNKLCTRLQQEQQQRKCKTPSNPTLYPSPSTHAQSALTH
jgi:hypothetical protein